MRSTDDDGPDALPTGGTAVSTARPRDRYRGNAGTRSRLAGNARTCGRRGCRTRILPDGASPPATPKDLLDLLEQSGRVVKLPDPPDETRAAWRRLIHALRESDQIPKGWHLLHRGRGVGDLVVEMRPGEHPVNRYRKSSRRALPVLDSLTNPHPVVDALRNEPHRLPASSGNRSRTLMIIEALAREAERRGHTVRGGAGATLLTVTVGDCAYDISMFEWSGARWTLRLAIDISGPGEGTNRWADYVKRPVEQNLLDVLDEIKRRARQVQTEQVTRQRREAERLAREQERLLTEHRARILRAEVEAWRLAEDIREHCEQLLAAGTKPGNGWIRWATRYANEIDPTIDPRGMPNSPNADDIPRERRGRDSSAHPSSPASDVERPWHPNRRWWSR